MTLADSIIHNWLSNDFVKSGKLTCPTAVCGNTGIAQMVETIEAVAKEVVWHIYIVHVQGLWDRAALKLHISTGVQTDLHA